MIKKFCEISSFQNLELIFTKRDFELVTLKVPRYALRKTEEKLFVCLSDKLGLCAMRTDCVACAANFVARFYVVVCRARVYCLGHKKNRRNKNHLRKDSDKLVEIFHEREKYI